MEKKEYEKRLHEISMKKDVPATLPIVTVAEIRLRTKQHNPMSSV